MGKTRKLLTKETLSRSDKIAIVDLVATRTHGLLPYQRTVDIVYKNHPNSFAVIVSESKYFRAHIQIDLDRHNTARELAQNVFHEFMHILNEPLATYAARLAKRSDDKIHKKNVDDAIEEVTSATELMFFSTVFPEYNEE